MKILYLITGAVGHLGLTIVQKLNDGQEKIRALILPDDPNEKNLPKEVEKCYGDVTDKSSLNKFFEKVKGYKQVVIHCAGIVSIASKFNPKVQEVNVEGTRNVVEKCIEENVEKLIYVSSVHAIPELPKGEIISEVKKFDPDKVEGLYAKTKAEATQIVLDAGKKGLNVNVVHPSGIAGPNDYGRGHITQLIIDYYKGTLTAGVNGGYDFVDVRDVADGIISCVSKGKSNECYILSNKYFAIKDLFNIFHDVTGKKNIRIFLPMWFAKMTAPMAESYYKLKKQSPLYTAYSMYTLTSNANFSHEKAEKELGYHVRPLEETVNDTVLFLKRNNRIAVKN